MNSLIKFKTPNDMTRTQTEFTFEILGCARELHVHLNKNRRNT